MTVLRPGYSTLDKRRVLTIAYDSTLADRIRSLMPNEPGLDERKMFGSIVFLVNGNMACGVSRENLIVRMHPDDAQTALSLPGTSVFDFTGRPMKGWVVVDPSALDDDAELVDWVRQGVEYACSLPPK